MALFDTDGTVTDVAVGTETLDGASPAVDLETPWGVGSVTKVFMSTVVLQLVEEGLLDVDEPVAPYVPQLVDGDRITVRHLLQHTSGLNDFLHQPPVTADATREWTTAEMLAVAEAAGRTGEPGATHHYSNTNYILLGDVVEQVTGHDWFDEVRSRIIEPLGLRHTGVVGFDEAPGYVMAGGALVVPPPAHPSLGGSSGGMQSTPADLLVFIRAVADGTLLTSESQALMRSWVPGDDLSKFGLLHRYGLGLESYSNDSITVVGHLGNGHAHSAFVGYDADRGTAVVVTLNANNPGAQALMALDALLAVARSEPASVP
jgi:D-alanyl-D-alanine carboxypeptidase